MKINWKLMKDKDLSEWIPTFFLDLEIKIDGSTVAAIGSDSSRPTACLGWNTWWSVIGSFESVLLLALNGPSNLLWSDWATAFDWKVEPERGNGAVAADWLDSLDLAAAPDWTVLLDWAVMLDLATALDCLAVFKWAAVLDCPAAVSLRNFWPLLDHRCRSWCWAPRESCCLVLTVVPLPR